MSVIPHTGEETILLKKVSGDLVNLENDIIGKYVEKLMGIEKKESPNWNMRKRQELQWSFWKNLDFKYTATGKE